MRRFLVTTAVFAGVIAATLAIGSAVRAQPYYGPGMMGGYGPGYGHMGGYGPGYMAGPGYGRGYGNNERYRGRRLCWHPTDSDGDEGYYAPCR